MPARIGKVGGNLGAYTVRTPGGVKAKHTTLRKAKRQQRLLNAVEHGFVPRKKKKTGGAGQ